MKIINNSSKFAALLVLATSFSNINAAAPGALDPAKRHADAKAEVARLKAELARYTKIASTLTNGHETAKNKLAKQKILETQNKLDKASAEERALSEKPSPSDHNLKG